MRRNKLYDLILKMLRQDQKYRNSDKELIWGVWERLGLIQYGKLSKDAFLSPKFPTTESIRRSRQKIQETHRELQASEGVRQARKRKARKKGTFIYQEEIPTKKSGHYEYEGNNAIWIED